MQFHRNLAGATLDRSRAGMLGGAKAKRCKWQYDLSVVKGEILYG